MSTQGREPSEETLASIRMYKERLAEIEESWKFAREAARANLLQAITEGGLSVAKASELSGHSRQTISTWLQVWNATQKAAKKSN
jgi:transposase